MGVKTKELSSIFTVQWAKFHVWVTARCLCYRFSLCHVLGSKGTVPGSPLPSTQGHVLWLNRLLQVGFSTKEALNSTQAYIHNPSKLASEHVLSFQVKKSKLKLSLDDHFLIPPSFKSLLKKVMYQISKWTHPLSMSDQDTMALTSSIPPLVNVSSGLSF